MLTAEPVHVPDLGDVDKARRVYIATRDIWIAGGGWLEPHERLSLLTVAAGLRPFSLLNHLDADQWASTAALLSECGLACAPCKANFDYKLDVSGPEEALQAYIEHELKYPLEGLGVWSRPDICPVVGLSELDTLLSYPECCGAMDRRTKAHDHSVTLQRLVDDADDSPTAVKAVLASGRHEVAWTEERHEWGKRLDQTRAMFPYAIHTACDECLEATDESPTAQLNGLYKRLTLAVSPELDLMIRWACELGRQSAAAYGPA